jgi:PPP family 3-phenylpropionic acid transporter
VPRRAALRLYYFVFFSAIGAYVPYFPAWLRARGIDGLRMSTVTMLVPLFGIVSPVAFGVVADVFGLRGSLLRVAATGSVLSFGAITAFGTGGDAASYASLLGFMTLFAFARGPMVSLADVTALEQPGSYGRTRLFGSAGFTAMVVAAGAFVDLKSARQLPLVITVVLALTLVVSLRLPAKAVRPPLPIAGDAVRLLKSPDFLLFLLGGFAWFGAHVAYDLCFSMHLADIGASPPMVGICWAIGVVAEILLMSVAHALFARYAITRLLVFGLVVTAGRFLVIAHLRSLPALLLLSPLHAFTFGLYWVASLEYVRRRVPSHVLATAQSLLAAMVALGSVLGMLAWGPLYAAKGGASVFTAAAVVAAVGCSFVIILVKISDRIESVEPTEPGQKAAPTPENS